MAAFNTITAAPFLLAALFCHPPESLKAEDRPGNWHTGVSFIVPNQGQFDSSVHYCLSSVHSKVLFFGDHLIYQYRFGDVSTHLPAGLPGRVILENLTISFPGSRQPVVYREGQPTGGRSHYFTGRDPSAWVTGIPVIPELRLENLFSGIDLVYYAGGSSVKTDVIVRPGGNLSDYRMCYGGNVSLSTGENQELLIRTENGLLRECIPMAYQRINGNKVAVQAFYTLHKGNTVGFECPGYDTACDLVIDPSLEFSTFVGGSGNELFLHGEVARDTTGNLFLTGRTGSNNFPVTAGSYDVTYNGGLYDAVVYKLSPDGGTLLFASFFGSAGYDAGYDLVVDANQDLYVIGTSGGSGFPTTPGSFQASSSGGIYDAFVLKLNPTGDTLLSGTLVSGTSDDLGHAITLDHLGDVYITGEAKGGFPTTVGSFQPNHGGSGGDFDAYAAKLSADLSTLIWSTNLGGPADDRGMNLLVDSSLCVYVMSQTEGNFPVTPGAYDTTFNGVSDVVLSKLNPAGSQLIYSSFVGGPGNDWPEYGIALTPDLEVTFCGYCGNGFPATPGAYDVSYNGGSSDMFVARLSQAGDSLVFSTLIGSNGADACWDLCVDPGGDIHLTGYSANNFPLTPCTFDSLYNGGVSDVVYFVLSPDVSQLEYATYIGGSGADRGNALLLDLDTVYLIGETGSQNFPVTGGYDTTYNGGTNDFFVLKLVPGYEVNAAFAAPDTLCEGAPATFTNLSNGATSYLWDFGDGNTSNQADPTHVYTATGNFLITLVAYSPCDTSGTAHALVIQPLPVVSLGPDTVICDSDSLLLDAGPGFDTYLWSNGDTGQTLTIHPSAASASYSVTVSLNGCLNQDTLLITLQQTTFQQSLSICQGDSLFLGGAWQHLPGVYHDTLALPASPCDSVMVTTLSVLPSFESFPHLFICEGDSVFLDGAYQSFPGIYTDSLYSVDGCDSVINTVLTVFPLPQVLLPGDTGFCEGSAMILQVQGTGTSFLWNTGAGTSSIGIGSPGVYAVTVTSDEGCQASDSTLVILLPDPELVIFPSSTVICSDSAVELQVSGAETYLWGPASGLSSTTDSIVTASPDFTLIYTVTGSLANGCSGQATVEVTVVETPVSFLADSLALCDGETVTLNAGYCEGCTYNWMDQGSGQYFDVSSPGLCWVEIANEGCGIRDSIDIRDCMEIWIPNVFTPNGDGLNETFRVEGTNIDGFRMVIFNRWGTELYETHDPEAGWDGKFRDEICPNGVYIYLIEYRGFRSNFQFIEKRATGAVTLLR